MPIRNIKAAARQSLRDRGNVPRRVTLLYALCFNIPALLVTVLDTVLTNTVNLGSTGLGSFNSFAAMSSVILTLSLLVTVFGRIWSANYQNLSLNLSRGKEVSFRDITAPFRILGKVIWTLLLVGIYTVLWIFVFSFPVTYLASLVAPEYMMMLTENPELMMTSPVTYIAAIPGLLMAYRYRLAILILFDHEDWRGGLTVELSKRALRGYKMDLFRLDLSFWWYYLLYYGLSLGLPMVLNRVLPELSPWVLLGINALLYTADVLLLTLFLPYVSCAEAHAYNYILEQRGDLMQLLMPPQPVNPGFPVFPGRQTPPPEDEFPVFRAPEMPEAPEAPEEPEKPTE